jgi:TolB-like protein
VRLDAALREVRLGDVRRRLQEQPCRILQLLLARPGVVVTRDELRQQLWPDGTVVDYEHGLNAAIRRLRAAIGDDPREPRYLETVPGRGYRWRVAAPQQGVRLAVLPFSAHGARADFAEGLADEVTAQLGRRGGAGLRVIARMSALACAGAASRASDLARSLAADYLLEGSVRRYRERARVAVWLVDAREEVQIWRGLYDRRVADPVPVQIELATGIADAVTASLRMTPGTTP